MLRPRTLQAKLFLSHIAVMVISVVVLGILVIVGYLFYLDSDAAAYWAGENAAYIAQDAGFFSEDTPFDEFTATEFILESDIVPFIDFMGFVENPDGRRFDEDREDERIGRDILAIISANGIVLASNRPSDLSSGTVASENNLPGYVPRVEFNYDDVIEDEVGTIPFVYSSLEEDHIGQAAIVNEDGRVLGQVYFSASGAGEPFLSPELLQQIGLFLLGAAVVSATLAAIFGGLMARSFGRRLAGLGGAASDFSSGNLDTRVEVKGSDEFDQLGTQFNSMADQLAGQMRQLRELSDRNALLAEEVRGLAAMEERNRLARELHDAVKQQIFAFGLTAASARQLMDQDPDLARERMAQLEVQARDALEEMDNVITQLRTAAIEDRGLASAIRELVRTWQEQNTVEVGTTISGERELPLATEQALYRVAQESLSNIGRHADAQRVDITLVVGQSEATLIVSDDGTGFDTSAPRGSTSFGLRGMDERVREMNGRLTIDSTPGGGTTVTATVPVTPIEVSYE